jgi:hypothetical protein
MMSKKPKKRKEDFLIFANFEVEKFIIKKIIQKKKTLIFEIYNLMGSMKEGLRFF